MTCQAGNGFGTISGPGGAPAALTVGAADTRPRVYTHLSSSARPVSLIQISTIFSAPVRLQ